MGGLPDNTSSRPPPWPQPAHRGRAEHGKHGQNVRALRRRTLSGGQCVFFWNSSPGICEHQASGQASHGFPLGQGGARPRMEILLDPRGGEPWLAEAPSPGTSEEETQVAWNCWVWPSSEVRSRLGLTATWKNYEGVQHKTLPRSPPIHSVARPPLQARAWDLTKTPLSHSLVLR